MTISNETNRSGPYNGNGVTTIFDYDFKISSEDHIKVVKTDTATGAETTLMIDADYIVSDVGNPDGGQVALVAAPATGTTITLLLNVPFTQETDYENQGPFFAETVESALDLAAQRDLQMREELGRAPKMRADFDGATPTLPNPEQGRVLQWDGGNLENGPTTGEISSAKDAAEAAAATATAQAGIATAAANDAIAARDDVVAGLAAQGAEIDAIQAKTDFLTVTAPTDLDAIRTRVNDLDAAVVLRGGWDASAGTFPGAGAAQSGDSYQVTVAGTVDGVDFSVNDRVIAITDNASTTVYAGNWLKADYSDLVSSVNGATGAVTVTAEDLGVGATDSPDFAKVQLGGAVAGRPLEVLGATEFSLGAGFTSASSQTGLLNHPLIELKNTDTTVGNGVQERYSVADTSGTARALAGLSAIATAKTASTVTGRLSWYTSDAGSVAERFRVDAGGATILGSGVLTQAGRTLSLSGGATGDVLTRDASGNAGWSSPGGGSAGNATTLGGELPAYYLDRANHTGTQDVGTVTGVIREFDSVADMVASSLLTVGDTVRTLGYYTPGDGGGNLYEIVAAGTGTVDGGSFINLSGVSGQAKGLFPGDLNPIQFGAQPSSGLGANVETDPDLSP